MHTVHIAIVKDAPSIVRPVKAVRAAFQYLGYDWGLQECQEIVKRAQEDGYTLLASDPDIIMIEKAARLVETESDNLVMAFVDRDEAWLKTRFAPIEVPADEPPYGEGEEAAPPAISATPTDAGYRGVIVLMSGANGDVARTLETILNLKANFPENPLWPEALVSLAAVHPWVQQVAQQVNQWPA